MTDLDLSVRLFIGVFVTIFITMTAGEVIAAWWRERDQ